MKNRLIISLLVAVLALSACAQPTDKPRETIATPPTIQTSKTPLDLLTEAINNTKSAACTIQYGTVTIDGDDTAERFHTQQIDPAHPFDWDALYSAVPDFPTNENLLSDFCSGALQAIPSNTGIIRYERTDLSGAELSALLYGKSAGALNAIGTIAIEVDASNRFTRLEFILEYDGADDTLRHDVTHSLSVLFQS
jgi:hypothetical protein